MMLLPNQARAAWPFVSDWIAEACEYHPCMNADDLLVLCEAGRCTLFIAEKDGTIVGVAVAEIIQYPSQRCANIIVIGGERNGEWMASIRDAVGEWGIQHGCKVLTGAGRRGWLKVAARYGFHVEQRAVASMELTDVQRRRRSSHGSGTE